MRALVAVVGVLLVAAASWLIFAPATDVTSFAGDIKADQPADYLTSLRRRIAPVRVPAATPASSGLPGGAAGATAVRASGISTPTRAATTPAPGASTPTVPAPTSTLGPALTPLPPSGGAPTSTIGPTVTTATGAGPTSTLGPTLTPVRAPA